MHIVDTTELTWDPIVPNTRGGDIYRKMIRGAEGVPNVDYDVRIELFSGGQGTYKSIRHRHDFEQLRFAVSGRMDLGFDVLEEGDIGYFPANAYYGPQECGEALILIAQWGDHFITKARSDAAVAELKEAGEFKEGFYHSVDEQGRPYKIDPLNAIWAKVFGRPYVPAPPRYKHPVLMTPSAFGWSSPDGATRSRRLGVFSEVSLEISTVQWVADGPLHVQLADNDNRPTLLFTTKGTFTHDGRGFGPLTGVWIESGESVKLDGSAQSELLMVHFPQPSSRITLGSGETPGVA
jgi:hypothetical protein